jgi:mannose-6-phosphate isomerase-like protein (cupin superfamily)
MLAFELSELLDQAAAEDQRYLEFLRVPDLSAGLYQLAAGATDPQNPHLEDEVYYVISGRAQIQVGKEMRPVQAGSIMYVAAEVPHKFSEIEEDLQILVFFAPAESP